MSRSRSIIAVSVLLFGGLATGCSQDGKRTEAAPGSEMSAAQSNCRHLDSALQWHAGVREFLQKAIDANSTCTGAAPAGARKVAIFDWDNTVVKNDIGYGTNFYMLAHDLILQPPNQDWKTTSRYLTDAGAKALTAACGTDVPAGKPLPTSTNTKCADEILAILDDETTTGEPAFAGYDERRMTGAYGWGAALSAGYTADELAGAECFDYGQHLVLPGLVDTHSTPTLIELVASGKPGLVILDHYLRRSGLTPEHLAGRYFPQDPGGTFWLRGDLQKRP